MLCYNITKGLQNVYGGGADPRWESKDISPCNGLRLLDISRGVQGTNIAVGVEGPRKSKPLNKSYRSSDDATLVTKDA